MYLPHQKKSTSTPINKKVAYHPALLQPTVGAMSSRIAALTTEVINEINWKDKKYKLEDYEKVLLEDPVINAVVELKSLRASVSLGKYTHPRKDIEEWVQSNFSDMDGKLEDFVSKAAIASYYGFFAGEIIWKNNSPGYKNEWRLGGLNPLNAKNVRFIGNKNGVSHIKYNSINIPIKKCIHIYRGSYDGDPYGVGLGRRAIPYFKAKQVLMSEWIVAGRNQSSGLLMGFADSNTTVQLLDSKGNPLKNPDGTPITVSAPENLLRQIEQLDSNRFIVTDGANRIQWQPMSVDSNFFQLVLQFMNRQLLLTQLAPSLTFEEGISGLGIGSGIANVQKGVLDVQLDALVSQIKDQIIENVVRPLLVWNFGFTGKEGWGDFGVDAASDPNLSLQKANTIIGAIASQILPSTDNAVTNVLRDLLGLPQQNEEEQLKQIQQSIAIQAMTQQALTVPPGAVQEEASLPEGENTNTGASYP